MSCEPDDHHDNRYEDEPDYIITPGVFQCNPCECGGHPDCPDCNPPQVTLTVMGRRWAQMNADESVVANVALYGAENDWPEKSVNAAIKACNEKGENIEPTDVEIYGAGSK